jgi:hypothetical protein
MQLKNELSRSNKKGWFQIASITGFETNLLILEIIRLKITALCVHP